MLNLLLIELKLITKIGGIQSYGKMSEDKLLSALNASKSEKIVIEIKKENLSLNELKIIANIRGIKTYEKMFKDKLLGTLNKSEPTKTRREMRKENHNKDKIHNDLDFIFDPEKDHYEPKKTVNTFNNNCIQYGSMADKDKNLFVKEYLDVIRLYLSDMIYKHKSQGKWRILATQ